MGSLHLAARRFADAMSDNCCCCKAPKTTCETFAWKGTLDNLQRAADDGCLRCSFLSKCIASFLTSLGDVFQKDNLFNVAKKFDSCGVIIRRNDMSEMAFDLDIFALDVGKNLTPFHNIPIKHLLPGDTSSNLTFKTIAKWMHDCISNHPDCNSWTPTIEDIPYSPQRLLDLTNERIVLREDIPGRPIYACLSHCWGCSNDITKTTTENIKKHKLGIQSEELSKTFQDAVDICRRLEINYLWVDSLCIIQDCKDDWNEQAPQMASIFRNAFLTIAATKSKGSTGGCFSITSPDYIAKPVPGTGVYVRRQPPIFPTHWFDLDTEEWPLLSRGWVYQEMRFSRRVLHFCSQEVIWKCRITRSESGSNDEEVPWHGNLPESELAAQAHKLWYETVQEYSRLQLTFETDKLPALAALTQDMEAVREDDRYLAGLWKSTLLLDLLWMASQSQKAGRSTAYGGPTWSWACVRSQIMWGGTVDHSLDSVEIVDIRYTTTGPACMAKVQEASITLRVPLLRARFDSGSILLDSTPLLLEDITISSYYLDFDFSAPSQCQISSPTEVFIAPIGVDITNREHTGLILSKKQDSDFYERLGCLQIQHRMLNMTDEELRAGVIAFSQPEPGIARDAIFELVNKYFLELPVCTVTIV